MRASKGLINCPIERLAKKSAGRVLGTHSPAISTASGKCVFVDTDKSRYYGTLCFEVTNEQGYRKANLI